MSTATPRPSATPARPTCRENTPVMAYELRNLFRDLALRGITAEDLGGPEYPDSPDYNYTPYFSSPREQWSASQRNQGDGRRYVEVYGAAKIVRISGPAAVLSPDRGPGQPGQPVAARDGRADQRRGDAHAAEQRPLQPAQRGRGDREPAAGQQTTGVSPRTAIVGSQLFQHSAPFNASQTAAQMGNWRYSWRDCRPVR